MQDEGKKVHRLPGRREQGTQRPDRNQQGCSGESKGEGCEMRAEQTGPGQVFEDTFGPGGRGGGHGLLCVLKKKSLCALDPGMEQRGWEAGLGRCCRP